MLIRSQIIKLNKKIVSAINYIMSSEQYTAELKKKIENLMALR